ncbi:hypothetical protein [Robertkochia sediminum]|uniref:hypothetical protein n=1 Tax=Robertkochia sediminum TaxID=2785326 RepID=UPI001932FA84|nr:hypothetical protein [Robertkochia sediminum]MBL7473719.1 hypothetical protein [Robertkochia sediminum]
MNVLEQVVYDAVKSDPRLKIFIRNQYQSLFDLFPRKRNWSRSSIAVKPGFFFGFHDVSPFSPDDRLLLANKLTIPLRMPEIDDPLQVGFFDGDNDFSEFNVIGESYAWNYHKGCRSQWTSDQKIIFNDAEDGRVVSRMYCPRSLEQKSFPFPIDSVMSDGPLASFFSYDRLEALMPGYGYRYRDHYAYVDENAPEKTGIFTMNLQSGAVCMHRSIKALSELPHVPESVREQSFFVTHSLFSPNGTYLAFLFRSVDPEYTAKRWSSLIVLNLKTDECHVAPTNGMVSHYVWNNKNQIVAYCRLGNIDSHVLFEDPSFKNYRRVGYPDLNSDGHQSFISDHEFITDTYPDKFRVANLYKVDMKKGTVTKLAALNSPKRFQSVPYSHWACDLHPRMNRKGDIVCFDSVHTGERSLCLMKIV